MRADYARRHPEVPVAALPRPSFKVKTANGLTAAIIEWIRLHGGAARRISVTGRTLDQRKHFIDVLGHHRHVGQVKWIPPSMVRGSADISCIVRTRQGVVIPWELEIKIGRDTQSSAQKAFEKSIKDAGGHYSIVRSLDDFVEQWEKLIEG